MRCFNCGVDLPSKSKYCPRCGSIFSKKEDVDLYCDREDIKYVNIYFSDNKINVYIYNISLGFLIFNFLYPFYKKLYIEGVISLCAFLLFWFMILGGGGLFVGSMGFFALAIIFSIMLSLFVYFYYLFNFNNIYIEKVKYRINKIVKENPGATEEEIISLCRKDSKPNWWLSLIIFCCILFVIFRVVFS